MTKEYSTRWFDEDARPIWERHILPRKDLINTYLEIGCGGGDSACWVLDNLAVDKAYVVDPWIKVSDQHDQATYDAARVKAKERLQPYIEDDGRVQLFEMSSRDFFGARFHEDCGRGNDHWDIADGTLDFCYVDGSHTGWDASFDMANAFYKLRPQRRLKKEPEDQTRPGLIQGSKGKWYEEGGIMVVDDQNRIHHRQQSETRLATYGYLVAYTGRYQMVAWSNRQLILTKV